MTPNEGGWHPKLRIRHAAGEAARLEDMLVHWEVGEYFPVCLQICRPHCSCEVLRTERLSTGVADEVDGARRHG